MPPFEVDTKRINVLSDTEDNESPIEKPTTLSISASPTPANSTNQLQKSMALLELAAEDNQALAYDLRGSLEALKQPDNTLAPPDISTQPATNSQLCPSQLPCTQPEEQAPQCSCWLTLMGNAAAPQARQ
eukprot:superscaffoldBa00000027_g544